MKKGLLKKILSILCAAGLVLSAAACASDGSGSPAASQEEASQKMTSDVQSTRNDADDTPDPLGKYDPPITVTSVRSISDENVFPAGDDIENNVYTRMLYDEMGIKVEYEWVVDSTQWNTKVAMMMASGSMPDFFRPGSADFMNLAQEDAVMDLTELYSQWASELLKTHDSNFVEGYEAGFVNGKHYGIAGLGWGTISLPGILWIRQDWLEQSGMEAPKTMDDLEALANKFMEDHPGTYGIALNKGLTGSVNTLTPIANAFHAYPGIWIDKTGELEYGSIQPEMKETLGYMQKLYSEGILDKEFTVKDNNKVIEDITNGKVGITFGGSDVGFWVTYNLTKNNADEYFMPYDVPTADKDPLFLQGNFPVYEYVVINKEAEHPEAVIKMMNLFCERFADGRFNEPEYKETVMWSYPPATQTDPTNEYASYVNVSTALTTGDDSVLTPQQQPFYTAAKKWMDEKDTITDTTAYGRYVQMGPEGAYSILSQYVDEDRILLDKKAGATPENYAKVSETLSTTQVDSFTKIIMGEPVDGFDSFVENWLKLGGEAATKEMNDIFN